MQDFSADPLLNAGLLKSVRQQQLTCPFWFLFRRIFQVINKTLAGAKFQILLHWLVALICAMYSLLIKANTREA